MPLWNELSEKLIDVIQRPGGVHLKREQVWWIRGFAYTMFSRQWSVTFALQKTNFDFAIFGINLNKN